VEKPKAWLSRLFCLDKIDLKKELKHLYNPSSKEVMAVDVPTMYFLMIDGKGDPNASPEYVAAIQTLFSVSYTLKFMIKKEKKIDYGVMPLEGLWWMDDMTKFSAERKDEWKWTAMIMQPKYVTEDLLKLAIEHTSKKKDLSALPKLRFENFSEGRAAQIMHIGPYSSETHSIQKIHAFIVANGHAISGKHHEIYLSDPRRTEQEKLRTVIRQPFT
jgi:hypothetical protein